MPDITPVSRDFALELSERQKTSRITAQDVLLSLSMAKQDDPIWVVLRTTLLPG
jgi:hypothetical protein